LPESKYKLVLRSFTDANEYIRQVKSKEIKCNDGIVFIDYYLGNGINAAHIIKLLKEYSSDTMVVLLSQSKSIKEKSKQVSCDYFVVKDNLAPALCCLYLKQYVENKYSIALD
jgi:hypothetical protein